MQARTLIIDDEPLARMRLRALLEKYTDDLEIVDEAASGNQAIDDVSSRTASHIVRSRFRSKAIDADAFRFARQNRFHHIALAGIVS